MSDEQRKEPAAEPELKRPEESVKDLEPDKDKAKDVKGGWVIKTA
jgi:hypothetical protein